MRHLRYESTGTARNPGTPGFAQSRPPSERQSARLEGTRAALTRRTLDDKNPDGRAPRQKITVEAVFARVCVGRGLCEFAEKRNGTVDVGELGDFLLLDRDLTRIPSPEIRNVRVLATVVGGETVFESGR
jgi:hypothetical protein